MDLFNAIDPMILSENEDRIPDALPVINAKSLALLGIENLNTGDEAVTRMLTTIETEFMNLQLMKMVTF